MDVPSAQQVALESATLQRFFRARIGADLVADLVQRTWAAFARARERIPAGVMLRAFLFGAARRELLMQLRKQYRGERALAKMAASEAAATLSQVIAAREQDQILHRALGRIPLDSRRALELYYWEELSIGEIAGVLEIPAGTVKSRLARARRLLRNAMLLPQPGREPIPAMGRSHNGA